MARTLGQLNFSSNYETKIVAPLDARLVAPTQNDLIDSNNYPFPYKGMIVSVTDDADPTKNGAYFLKNFPSTNLSNWEKVGGAGIGTENYVPKWGTSGSGLTSTSLIFDNGTNVGVGTTSPSVKLDVNGDINGQKITITQDLNPGVIVKHSTVAGIVTNINSYKIESAYDTGAGQSNQIIIDTVAAPSLIPRIQIFAGYQNSGFCRLSSPGDYGSLHLGRNGTTNAIELRSPSSLTSATTVFLPNANGTLVLSVNGSAPNASGAVTIPNASSSQTGLLTSSNWTTFNDKIGGSGTPNYVPKFTASGTIGNGTIFDNGSIGIGTASPASSAILHLSSTTKGFLPPSMTTAQRNAISSPAYGLIVYDNDLDALCMYSNKNNWLEFTTTTAP